MFEERMEARRQMGMRLLLLIVDAERTARAEEVLKKSGLPIRFRCAGRGTAASQMLDVLGLDENDKTILLCAVPKYISGGLMQRLSDALYLRDTGGGIALTLPVDGISSNMMRLLDKEHCEELIKRTQREVERMTEQASYGLIMAVINPGFSEELMEVARATGAKGGTVIHARQMGLEDTMNFWGISIQGEKEIILILARKEDKTAIMRAVGEKFGMHSKAHGFVLSMPVDEIAGIETDE